jgi:adenylate cyclase
MLPEINELSFRPSVSIGIGSGEVISGNIGSVSLRRLDYTVLGDVANTAKRLQSTARPGQVVIPAAVYQKIKESFKCVSLGEFSLKNKARPVEIYEVVE